MTRDLHPPFSRRLDWLRDENALAAAQAARRHAGAPIIDLTESNPTAVGLDGDQGADTLADAFRRAACAPYQPHPRGDRRAREAIAAQYSAAGHLGAPDGPSGSDGRADLDGLVDRLVLTTSSSESCSFLWKLLCDPGDTVLVPEPSYPLFDFLARLEGVATLPYRLTHDGTRTGDWHLDLATVDEALAAAPGRVAALVLVSPHNPTGLVLDGDQLAALDRRAAARGFALVADEVFADYREGATSAQVPFLAGRETAALTFSLGGLSKSCGFPQLKLGWIAAGGPDALARQALAGLELIADTYLSVGSAIQLALPDLLPIGAARRRQIGARIAQNRRCLLQILGAASPLSVLKSQGGWAAILRLPAVRTDEQWALAFLEQHGVLVHPGFFFDLQGATYVVVSLLTAPAAFREGLEKITACVARTVG